MAIEIDLQSSEFGVPFAGAYFRVVTAAVSRLRGGDRSVMIDVVGYATKPTNDDTKEIAFMRYHVPYLDVESQVADDFVAKCYLWVMAQSEMVGASAV